MNKLRSDDLSVIVRIQHGIGFELTEGSVTVEATFDGDLRQGLHTLSALRNRVNFDERFVWLADRATVKNMRMENGVVLVECFRIPTVPADRGAYANDELYERQRVGQAVVRLKDFQVIGRDWDQEVTLRSYKLHCGTGNGNVALRMALVIKDTTAPTAAAAVFNRLPAARPQARHRRPRETSVTADRQQPVTNNRLQSVAADRPRPNVTNRQPPQQVTNRPRPDDTNRPQSVATARRPQPVTAKNLQPAAKTNTKREVYKRAKTPVAAYLGAKDANVDDNTNSMRVYENVNLSRVHDYCSSNHLHKCTCRHDKIGLGASSVATDDFIKTMEHLTVDMGEVRRKTFRQCEAVNDCANMSGLNVNETTRKKPSRMGGGKGVIDRLDPSERHRGGTITAATSRESLLAMTTGSAMSDDAVTCVRRIRKCNNTMSNVIRDIQHYNGKTCGTAADLSCSSQSDYDMQHPIMLVEELQKSVNQFADCFYRTRKKRHCTKAKYSRGMTVLKKLDVETTKLNDKIRDVWQAACNQCHKPLQQQRPI